MSMKKLLLFLFIPSFLSFVASAQDKWDLKRCVDYAVTNNISIKQADVTARLAKLTLDQSRLSQIPALTAGVSAGINSGRFQNPTTYVLETQTTFQSGLSLQSSVTLFNGFYLQRTIEANRYNWQAMLASTELLKNNITLNVANAYLTVLLANQTAEAALLQLHLSQNQLELTHKQVVAGTLPELNAAELESQVAQDSSSYIIDKSNVVQDILQLKAYMDLDASTPFDVDTPPVDSIPIEQLADLQPDAVFALALSHQPQQKMDALQIQSYQETVRATKGAMYPVVSLYGALSSYYLNTPGEAAVIYGTTVDTVGHVVGSGTPVTSPAPLYKIVDTKAPG